MAWPPHVPSLQFSSGHRDQSTEWNRLELEVVVNLCPNTLLTELEIATLDGMGLDGHWLIVAVVNYLPGLSLDLRAPARVFSNQVTRALQMMSDILFNDIVSGFEADGKDDDWLDRLDASLVEDMPQVLSATETIIMEVCNVLRNYDPPHHCLKKTLLSYLIGYSLHDSHSGRLHFLFTDHEHRHSVRL